MKLHILKRNQSFWSLGCSLPSFYCGCYCFQSILSFWCILEQEGKRLIFVDSKLHFSRSVISLKTADGWGMLQGILREKYWTVMECELSTVSKLYLLGLLLTKWISWISTWNSISSYSVLNVEEVFSEQFVTEVFPASSVCPKMLLEIT